MAMPKARLIVFMLVIGCATIAMKLAAMQYVAIGRSPGMRLRYSDPVVGSRIARRCEGEGVVPFKCGLAQYTDVPPPVFQDEEVTEKEPEVVVEAVGPETKGFDWEVFTPLLLGVVFGAILAFTTAKFLVLTGESPGSGLFGVIWFAAALFITVFGWPDLGPVGNGIAGGGACALALATVQGAFESYKLYLVIAVIGGTWLAEKAKNNRAMKKKAKELAEKEARRQQLAEERREVEQLIRNQTDKGWFA